MGALEPLPSDIRRSLTAPERPCAETVRVPVLKVFDGDGFLTRINTHRGEVEATIRFGFVDAPEIGQRGGNSAREFLKSLISDKWLDIVVLTKMDTGQIVDRYGRIVGIPYLTQELLYSRKGLSGRAHSNLMRHRSAKQATPLRSTKTASGMAANGDN